MRVRLVNRMHINLADETSRQQVLEQNIAFFLQQSHKVLFAALLKAMEDVEDAVVDCLLECGYVELLRD